MAYQLNDKISVLKPYQPLQGSYRIRLDANESFLPPPEWLKEKFAQAMRELPFNRYPDPFAKELCESFAGFYSVAPSLVTAGNGSDELIFVISVAFLQKGEAMLALSPDFSMYRFYSGLNEAKCLEYRKRPDLTVDVDEVIRMANENDVKLLLFSNPCNPTSKGLPREEVRRLVRSVSALVVLDEAYMDFWDQSLLNEVNDYDNLIILRTCSKAIGMAGIRLGFAVANHTLTNALKMVKSPYNVNLLTQKIGSIILREREWIELSIVRIRHSKLELQAMLEELEKTVPGRFGVVDGVTNFVPVQLPDAPQLREKLRQTGISVSGFEDCLRITAGASEENEGFVRAFQVLL